MVFSYRLQVAGLCVDMHGTRVPQHRTSSAAAEKETSAPSARAPFGKPTSLKWKNRRTSRSAHLRIRVYIVACIIITLGLAFGPAS